MQTFPLIFRMVLIVLSLTLCFYFYTKKVDYKNKQKVILNTVCTIVSFLLFIILTFSLSAYIDIEKNKNIKSYDVTINYKIINNKYVPIDTIYKTVK